MLRKLVPLLVLSAVLGLAIGHAARPVAAAPYHCNQVNFHPSALATGNQNIPYSQHIWITPNNMYFCYWNVTGLPVGLNFTPGPQPNEGYITGTPTVVGTSTVTIGDGCVYLLGTICPLAPTFTLTVNP
jgi:hypothetical protein